MMQEPEDDRLDQSLRDTFSDFDLPPAGHIWTGIEGRLATLPAPPRSVPLLLLLPIVGVVGVAVGWLLPRPALFELTPQPKSVGAAQARLASQHSQLPTVAVTAAPLVAPTTALGLAARPRAIALIRPVRQPAQATTLFRSREPGDFSGPRSTSEPLVALAGLAELLTLESVSTAISLPSRIENSLPITLPVAEQAVDKSAPAPEAVKLSFPADDYAAEMPDAAPKGEISRDRRPGYRTPTHRLAERGRGLRRIQSTVSKHWQRLFGSRRARAAAQPDF